MPDLIDYLEARSIPEPNSGCQLWLLAVHPKGYGTAWHHGVIFAHRLSWIAHRGEIPKGQQVLHKCDVPGCINPAHLFLGSNDDNHEDKVAKGRQAKGERNFPAKLKTIQVLAIRAMLENAPRGMAPLLAEQYGVSLSTIYDIEDRRTWKHV